MASQQITDFFKASKKKPVVLPSTEVKNTTDQFYSLCLHEKLENCKNPNCSKEKHELKVKRIEQEEKLKEINRAIDLCLAICRKKEEKIGQLMPKRKVPEKVNDPVACPGVPNDANKMLSKFENDFTQNDLAKLRSMGTTKTDDSSFILNSIRFLYKNDTDKISSLSLTGRSRGTAAKQKMSPQKYDTIKDLFTERLSSLELNSIDFAERSKELNKHMKNAFINVKRSGKSNNDEEMIQKINENKNE